MFGCWFFAVAVLCFSTSTLADDDADSTKGLFLKGSDRQCFCGNLYLPEYDKISKDRGTEKYRVLADDVYILERFKTKKYRKKCSCFAGKGSPQEIGYQIDKYAASTADPRIDESYQIEERYRFKRESELDQVKGVSNLEEGVKPEETVGAVMEKVEDIVSHHNPNKTAQVLDKIGYGLGVASDVVQRVGDQVGSTFGGQMAQSVLNQVSFGLGLASETTKTVAESKRSGRKRRSSHRRSDHGIQDTQLRMLKKSLLNHQMITMKKKTAPSHYSSL